ncbi:tetratricopeptide repeat protein [Pseudoalteromonas luteoviolacea]|uniref:Uncharacterized protein n=1 Tax=Pseudoalteromonas luteoviolacea NCIMB 1942 TaxID=1365253 RepID=A0A167CJK3_9GAMM|nr:hypothetical protein [Pseudoalteromonas luteoviolacea]KZN47738.1 hypothetical protein N482_08930 [Pseudoalteromonas luteoviolacea NCIMB 1942]KZW99751.1 hypothetical protein JL49_15455 [Pseudoalteromonas luteoviolacea]
MTRVIRVKPQEPVAEPSCLSEQFTYACHSKMKTKVIEAFDYVNAGNIDKAIETLKSIQPVDSYVLVVVDYYIGSISFQNQMLKQAITYLNRAVDSKELNAKHLKKAMESLLEIHIKLRNYDQAG